MPRCELLDTCVFFRGQMAEMPDLAELQKKKYCLGDNSICARYRVCKRLGREKVPPDLFPIDMKRAEKIIGGE